MKTRIIASIILPLLLLLSVAAVLVWFLPVKVTLFLVIILQLLMLIALGAQQNSQSHEQDS